MFIINPIQDKSSMITSAQMRAGRALLGIDQQTLADLAGVSLPTIQRMEASEGNVRGVVDTLTKVIAAFDLTGVELIAENTPSVGQGRGVRFKVGARVKATEHPRATLRKKGLLGRLR
jgi:transcriptional regulator with XRE-family HTH domain